MSAPQPPSSSSFFATKLTLRQVLTKRRIVVVAVVGVAALTWAQREQLFGSETATDPDASSSTPQLPVETVLVSPSNSYETKVDFTGRVEARRTTALSFELGGKVETVMMNEGDSVEAGQQLARLDTALLQSQRAKADAQLQQARAQLDEMIAGPRTEVIAEARAMMAAAEATFQRLDEERQRKDALHERRVATLKERNDARNDAAEAAAQLQAARERLAELEAGTRKEQIAAQRAAVDAWTAELDNIDVNLEKSTLHAPYPGRITRRMIDEGTVVTAGQVLGRLVESSVLELHVGVPIEIADTLNVGDSQSVVIRNQNISGTIDSIVAEVDDRTRTRKVVIALPPDVEANIVSGEVGYLRSHRNVDATGYWVPLDALVRSSRGLWACYAVVIDEQSNENVVDKRDVELIYSDAHRAFVRGLLNDGDHIVTSGVHRLSPGQVVSYPK